MLISRVTILQETFDANITKLAETTMVIEIESCLKKKE